MHQIFVFGVVHKCRQSYLDLDLIPRHACKYFDPLLTPLERDVINLWMTLLTILHINIISIF